MKTLATIFALVAVAFCLAGLWLAGSFLACGASAFLYQSNDNTELED